ncbi:MAG: GNAT family N-acetyltransferase [Bacilli bacterium]
MKEIRRVLALIRKADEHYNLFERGDRIVLGVSGGKDSLLLFHALKLYQKFVGKDFTLFPVLLDLGFPTFDATPVQQFIARYGDELIIADATTIFPILLEQQKRQKLDHLPCSICSRMKKAAINRVAHSLNANKVAFAHHVDDAIETLVLNAIYGGRIATFAPKMFLSEAKITLIRPLILVKEKMIIKSCQELKIPVMLSPCPSDQETKRTDVKELLTKIYKHFPEAEHNFVTLLNNEPQRDLWEDKLELPTALPELKVRPVSTMKDKTAVLYIRSKVFIEEQGITLDEEITNEENDAQYFLLLHHDRPIGTIRYLEHQDHFHLGRFALLQEARGQGYGTIFLQFIEKYLSERVDPLKLTFNGQANLDSFYQKRGYTRLGQPFLEAGILHYRYEKIISKNK